MFAAAMSGSCGETSGAGRAGSSRHAGAGHLVAARLVAAGLAAVLSLGAVTVAAVPAIALATPYGNLPASVERNAAAADDYVGWWCPADEAGSVVAADGSTYQLHVVGQTSAHLVLELSCTVAGDQMGSANALGTIVAPIEDGTARFSFADGQGRIYDAGIELDANAIEVSVAQTDAYQTLMPYESVSLETQSTFVREAHHFGKLDAIGWGGSYVQPSSSWEVLDESLLAYSSPLMLELARNEIYARHGYIFQTDYLAQYFSTKDWYVPLYTADQFDESWLTDAEKTNVMNLKHKQEQWELLSNGTTFVATAGSYRQNQYGAWDEGASEPARLAVSFGEEGTVTLAFDGLDGQVGGRTVTARITDDTEAVFDVEGGQIVGTWNSPGYLFLSWRGTGEAPQQWADLVYATYMNPDYVALG